MKFISIILTILFLNGCASTEPYLNQEPVQTYDSPSDYWLSDVNVQPLKFLTAQQYRLLKGKHIKIKTKFLIDSNGDVHNVEVIESNVDVSMLSLAEKAMQQRDFYPSKSNSSRQPMIAFALLEFTCD